MKLVCWFILVAVVLAVVVVIASQQTLAQVDPDDDPISFDAGLPEDD